MRRAVADDRGSVETIVRDAYAPYVARIGRPPGPMLDDYGALIQQRRVWVAEAEGAILGMLVLVPERAALLLDNVAVSRTAQGRGVGRALLSHAERVAREAGYGTVRLYTHELMTENIALYTRIGYVETHRGEEKGLRRVYMAKTLAPVQTDLAGAAGLLAARK